MENHQQGNPDFGYRFEPPAYKNAPGHPAMEIRLFASPTGRHFDPMVVRIQACPRKARTVEGIDHISIVHPWKFDEMVRVCPGRLQIEDHLGKVLEAFTFGGRMTIHSDAEHTDCRLQSEAPILPLDDPTSPAAILVDEVEILLAEQRAAWMPDEVGYARVLDTIPPLQLYASCLSALKHRFERAKPAERAHNRELIELIEAEIKAHREELQDWPSRVPALEEIFAQ